MKEYEVSEKKACEELYKLVDSTWKEINEEYLNLYGHLPEPILKSIINIAKSSHVFYDEDDFYTHVGEKMQTYIEDGLINPIPI